MRSWLWGAALCVLGALASWGCGGDDDDNGGGGATFDCAAYAAAFCDPACACREGPKCAAGNGGRSAVVWDSRDECLGFYQPTCDFVVANGGAAQLAADWADCSEDLPTAECTDADMNGERALITPDSCRSGQ